MSKQPQVSPVRSPGPHEVHDPLVRAEIRRAAIWIGMVAGAGLVVLLIEPLLIIFGGLVFAAMLDGGVRLLRRVAPIPRGPAVLLLMLAAIAFVLGVFYLTGVEIASQAEQLRATLETQWQRVSQWAASAGLAPSSADLNSLVDQGMQSLGRVTSFVSSAVGAITSLVMIFVIGLFVAFEPRLYSRGLQWMVPLSWRDEFHVTLSRMGHTMRMLLAGRLAGMAFEGVLTWILLALAGVPMALLLGILTGLLAFIPNVGAFISGALMVAVGFSAGFETGVWALGIYAAVQIFDGYVVIPMVARKTVDLPPALTLSAQILASTLFGVLGLALADPITAMVKVALDRESEREEEQFGTADAEGDDD